MNLIYAALLLNSAEKEITEENLKKVAKSIGNVEESQVKALVTALEGVDITEVIKNAAMPVAAPAAVAAPVEVKKEEESAEDQEKKAEEAAAGLSALFG